MPRASLTAALDDASRALPKNVIVTKHDTPQEG